MKVTEDNTSPKATFTKMKARGPAPEHSNRKGRAEKANSSSFDNEETPQETRLFQCPNYGYVKSFQRFSSLHRHLDAGKYILERETLLDKAMQSYATKLVQGNVGLESQPRGEPDTSRIIDSPSKNWGLKSSAVQRERFKWSQKQYLKCFDLGEQCGHKVDANNVSIYEKSKEHWRFSYVRCNQITSF